MAYAMLAGVEPVTGIYTAIWPVLVYVVLGNMPHVSMGTFAVVSILVNQVGSVSVRADTQIVMTTLCQVVQSVITSPQELSSPQHFQPLPLHHHQDLSSLHSPPVHQLTSALQTDPSSPQTDPSALEIVTAVTFSVGVIQALIGLLRVGSLTLVINDVIISSFTTGASMHVATSQVRHVLGLGKLVGVSGPGRLVQTYLSLGNDLSESLSTY